MNLLDFLIKLCHYRILMKTFATDVVFLMVSMVHNRVPFAGRADRMVFAAGPPPCGDFLQPKGRGASFSSGGWDWGDGDFDA